MAFPAQQAVYRFGGFVLDLGRGALLTADGAPIPLRPKSFALLQLLLENAGRLLERDAIMAALWPNIYVTDDSITQCMRDVRRALGPGADEFLCTVNRRGYRFMADVAVERLPSGPGPLLRSERTELSRRSRRSAPVRYAHEFVRRQTMDQRAAPRQPCNLSLPADLVQRACRYTNNLSGIVEDLLAAWTARAAAEAQASAKQTQRLLAGLERLRNEVGSLADDFSPL